MNLTDLPQAAATPRPELAEVEAAVRTLLRWAGDDPTREGLLDTPNRVARAYREFFSGYEENPHSSGSTPISPR